MLADEDIAKVMRELTLLDRPFRRSFWLVRGFERIDRRPGRLLGYWRRRLETDTRMAYVAHGLLKRWQHSPPPEPPTLPERAGSLLRATARFAKSGFKAVSSDVLIAREDICRECPEWDPQAFSATGKCRKCGCSTWAKLRMPAESCPLGKWSAA